MFLTLDNNHYIREHSYLLRIETHYLVKIIQI